MTKHLSPKSLTLPTSQLPKKGNSPPCGALHSRGLGAPQLQLGPALLHDRNPAGRTGPWPSRARRQWERGGLKQLMEPRPANPSAAPRASLRGEGERLPAPTTHAGAGHRSACPSRVTRAPRGSLLTSWRQEAAGPATSAPRTLAASRRPRAAARAGLHMPPPEESARPAPNGRFCARQPRDWAGAATTAPQRRGGLPAGALTPQALCTCDIVS